MAAETTAYQAFIPYDYVPGPGILAGSVSCPVDIYAGDNRGFNPLIGSYRGFQALTVGVGGLTLYVPPAFDTGYTFEFNRAILQNNIIPETAYNYDYLGKCTTQGIDEKGKESTAGLVPPVATYNGQSPSTLFEATIANPVSLLSFPIYWSTPVTLTEPDPTTLHVSGTLFSTCFPAHEVSVGGVDVGTWMPTANDLGTITTCLSRVNMVVKAISKDIPLTPYIGN